MGRAGYGRMKSAFGYRARGPGDRGRAKKDQRDPVRGPGKDECLLFLECSGFTAFCVFYP